MYTAWRHLQWNCEGESNKWTLPPEHWAGSGSIGCWPTSFRAKVTSLPFPTSVGLCMYMGVCVCVCVCVWCVCVGDGRYELLPFRKAPLLSCLTSVWYPPTLSFTVCSWGITTRRCQQVFGKHTLLGYLEEEGGGGRWGPAESNGLHRAVATSSSGYEGQEAVEWVLMRQQGTGICFQSPDSPALQLHILTPEVNISDGREYQIMSDIHPHHLPREQHIHFDCSPHNW